jgi:hypothetical protein
MGELERLSREVIRGILAKSEPRRERTRATVESLIRDSSGSPYLATARLVGGALVTVPCLGWLHIAEGAGLLLETRGPHTAADYSIIRITRRGNGTGSSDPSIPLSTPSIDGVMQEVVIGAGGFVSTRLTVTIGQIKEQYSDRLMIQYVVEVRDATSGLPIASRTAIGQPNAIAQLNLGIDDTDTELGYVSVPEYGALSENFPLAEGIIQIEDEQLKYAYRAPVLSIDVMFELERGYNSTTPAAHVEGTVIRSQTVTIVIDGIPALGQDVELRATAQCITDGRKSNPSDWYPLTIDSDTTAPSWASTPTPTITAKSTYFLVEWPAADTDATDLSHYEVDVSTDGSTWGNVYNAGNGLRFVYPASSSDTRYFRVRAKDTTGNVSAWSNSANATAP